MDPFGKNNFFETLKPPTTAANRHEMIKYLANCNYYPIPCDNNFPKPYNMILLILFIILTS